MTVKEIINGYKGQYTRVELFLTTEKANAFHTDTVRSYDPQCGYGDCEAGDEERLNDVALTMDVLFHELMSVSDYDSTILANCGVSTKDYGWTYKEKILCIAISDKVNVYTGEFPG